MVLDSGVIQEVRGNLDQGIWTMDKNVCFIYLPFEDQEVRKEVPLQLVNLVKWSLVQEKLQNKDYENLPTRKDFDKMDLQDFLLSIGVLEVQTIPNQWVNGQPAQQLLVTPEYQV